VADKWKAAVIVMLEDLPAFMENFMPVNYKVHSQTIKSPLIRFQCDEPVIHSVTIGL
jgi:hypothetical protein